MTQKGWQRPQLLQGERLAQVPLLALVIGTAVLFTGLTAAAMTIASDGDGGPPPATRASVTTIPRPAAAPTSGTPAGATPSSPASPSSPSSPPPTTPPTVEQPIAVAIPAIKVLADVDPLGLTPKGVLRAPTDFERVGWWFGGHKPGEPGPAVLDGHVDSTKGPAVFYALRELRPGDEIRVVRRDRSTAVFVVDRLSSYPKNHFPSLEVYGPTDASTLRLITCTGSFNRSRHSYRDNLVVYASLKA
ncbi:MAG: class F sortase [Actinomycetota bacterium]|nr:class F sortase [Actinomycetota bacterium]